MSRDKHVHDTAESESDAQQRETDDMELINKLANDAVARGGDEPTELYKQLAQWRGIRALGGYWVEYPAHTVAAWQAEVANDDTRESYDEFVINEIEKAYYADNEEDVP